jgi:methylenetetrahydrofolate reductase (NADPH)
MPPRDVNCAPNFWQCVDKLSKTHPDFLSVTYGAGGNDRKTSLEVNAKIVEDSPILPVAHLTCIDTPKDAVEDIANDFLAKGVRIFLALRGDHPKNSCYRDEIGPDTELVRDAAQLTYLLRSLDKKRQRQTQADKFKSITRPLVIGVATFPDGNPDLGTSASGEVERLLQKQDAGADFAITQLYYDPKVFDDFISLARKRGVTIPIIAGVLPTWSPERLLRCEANIGIKPPHDLVRSLADACDTDSDDQRAREIGLAFWEDLCKRALESGAPGVHMFTFNKWEPPIALTERLEF